MTTTSSSPTNSAIAELVSAGSCATIDEVIARMQSLDALLGEDNGLKWFNRLYMMVTEQVNAGPTSGS